MDPVLTLKKIVLTWAMASTYVWVIKWHSFFFMLIEPSARDRLCALTGGWTWPLG